MPRLLLSALSILVISAILLVTSLNNMKCRLPTGLHIPPAVSHAVYMNYGLSRDELSAVAANFTELPSKRRIMRQRADAHLMCYIPGISEPKHYAIFLYEGLIYEGLDSEAWVVHSQGGRSLVYEMNAGTKALLDTLALEAEAQSRRRALGGNL